MTHHRDRFILHSAVLASGSTIVVIAGVCAPFNTVIVRADGSEVDGTYRAHDTLRRAINHCNRVVA